MSLHASITSAGGAGEQFSLESQRPPEVPTYKKLMYTVNSPDAGFGKMVLEQFGGRTARPEHVGEDKHARP